MKEIKGIIDLSLLAGAFWALLIVVSSKPSDFARGGPHGWWAVKALADKYELEMPTRLFGSSRCSIASRIYFEAAKKDKNINGFDDLMADPSFGRVRVYAYRNCLGHKDWPLPFFG